MTFTTKYGEKQGMNTVSDTGAPFNKPILQRFLEKASTVLAIATSDINDIIRGVKTTTLEIDDNYKSKHIDELKGNWNIIISKKSKQSEAK